MFWDIQILYLVLNDFPQFLSFCPPSFHLFQNSFLCLLNGLISTLAFIQGELMLRFLEVGLGSYIIVK